MDQLAIGTEVDVYACEGAGKPRVWQGTAVIAGYAGNSCYIVSRDGFGWYRHASEVRITGHTMPADWYPAKGGR